MNTTWKLMVALDYMYEDARLIVPMIALTLLTQNTNVLAIALDHMYEHLTDLVGDLDTSEEENINLTSRIDDVLSLKEMFNL